ncbi:hypothetical protein DUNSADRAFT_361 [Dunaliella salina]|uniref:Secreted protein n=1 Tax=Dunaliella salina TaxID=3046 RepID=A0ABQ7FZ08_DUNSA|nr:hypothetical protein DUNSADRAFT_361 [Dunaliella salina]|eukprot:KAF5827594.1 hypothetical protein DUNSADRAFT_361 [Dunaliella salina]
MLFGTAAVLGSGCIIECHTTLKQRCGFRVITSCGGAAPRLVLRKRVMAHLEWLLILADASATLHSRAWGPYDLDDPSPCAQGSDLSSTQACVLVGCSAAAACSSPPIRLAGDARPCCCCCCCHSTLQESKIGACCL